MGSGRGWRRSPAGGFWRRAGRRAANAFPPEGWLSRSARDFVGRKLETLKVRADFLRVASAGRRSAAPGLVVQAAPHPRQPSCAMGIRVGFTASRKVGNAVVRNRAKRRMRAAAASILPAVRQPGTDYVLIARAGTADRPFADLIADLEAALRRIGRGGAPRPSGPGPTLLSHEASGEAHQARHQPRPQQA